MSMLEKFWPLASMSPKLGVHGDHLVHSRAKPCLKVSFTKFECAAFFTQGSRAFALLSAAETGNPTDEQACANLVTHNPCLLGVPA